MFGCTTFALRSNHGYLAWILHLEALDLLLGSGLNLFHFEQCNGFEWQQFGLAEDKVWLLLNDHHVLAGDDGSKFTLLGHGRIVEREKGTRNKTKITKKRHLFSSTNKQENQVTMETEQVFLFIIYKTQLAINWRIWWKHSNVGNWTWHSATWQSLWWLESNTRGAGKPYRVACRSGMSARTKTKKLLEL